MLLSLNHVTLRSADLDRCERFYCGLIGLRPGRRPALGVPGRWFYLGAEAVVHVLPALHDATSVSGPVDGVIDHFALQVSSLRRSMMRLRAAGHPFRMLPLPGTRVMQLFVRDPDGARIELCRTPQRNAARKRRADSPAH